MQTSYQLKGQVPASFGHTAQCAHSLACLIGTVYGQQGCKLTAGTGQFFPLKLESSGKGVLRSRNYGYSIGPWVCLWGIFFMNNDKCGRTQPTLGSATPGQMVLDYAESTIAQYFILVPAWTSLSGGL